MLSDTAQPWNQLTVIDSDGEEVVKPRGRIKSPNDLLACWQKLFEEDRFASQKRAQVQGAVNGESPYDPEREKQMGMAGRSNVNFGDMAEFVQNSIKPYLSILESMDTFGTSPIRTESEQDKLRFGDIISKEIARAIKKWPDFYANWGQNVTLMKLDGTSFCYFPDSHDWRYCTAGLMKMKFTRRVKASVEALDMICCEDTIAPHILYQKIQSEKELPEEQRRWNEREVYEAIKNAGPQQPNMTDFEQWQRIYKGNDLTYGVTGNTVTVIHGWVREVDGTVSHYISRKNLGDGVGEGTFLYKEEGKYRSMNSFIHAYFGDFGTNGDFHSIRGEGYKVFPSMTARNRVKNKFIDASIHSATPHLTAPSESQITQRSITPMGPYIVMDPQMAFAETHTPPLQQNLVPAMQLLDNMVASKSMSGSAAYSGQQTRTQKTKYQVQTEVEQSASLSASDFFLFMTAWERHYKEIVRRMTDRDYLMTDPGGAEVHTMIARIVSQGVPKEVFYSIDIDGIEINTGIGKGSASERRLVMDQIYTTVYPNLDQEARATIDRAYIAGLTNDSFAQYCVPPNPNLRPPMDAQIAKLENSAMSLGQPPAFEINQNHEVHVGIHLERLYELLTQHTELEIDLAQAVDSMQPMWEHAQRDHMPNISQNNPRYKEYKEGLQQLGEFINNGRKSVEKMRMKEAEDAEIAQQDIDLGSLSSGIDAQARAGEEGALAIERERNRITQERRKGELEAMKLGLEIKGEQQQLEINDINTSLNVAKSLNPPAKKTTTPKK